MKKVVAIVLVLVLVLSFAACAKKAPEAAASEAKLKVCIVNSSGVDDGNFTQNCWEGIQDFIANHPDCTANSVKEPDLAKLIPTVEQLVGDYDVFVLPGFNFGAVGDIVQANPDKYFIVVDTTVTDSQGNALAAADLGNVYTMGFKENQSAFPAGVAAALESKTGKVAEVNGIAFPSNVNYEYGFYAGINYANKHYGTNCTYVELPSYAGTDVLGNPVGGNYVGNFADEATGKVIAENLIKEGVDILFAAAGSSGNGVLAAAKEANIMYIGCDVDQWNDCAVGDKNICLTSTLKVMRPAVEKQLNAIYDGTFKGEDAILTAADGGVGYVTADGRHQMSADTLAKVKEAMDAVIAGTVVVPGDVTANEQTDPTNFPGL